MIAGHNTQHPTKATVLAAAPLHILPEAGVLPVSLAARPLVGAVVGGVGGHTLGARAQPAALIRLDVLLFSL